ncbi:MAG: gliding motility-associated C-terminal domain-containing protein [Bacteroidota bacterium]
MKNIITTLIIVLIYSFIITSAGQGIETSKKYRVTAYKNSSEKIYSRSNEAEVLQLFSLYIPNTFTPNGDGLNDMFGPAGTGISEFQLQIFNRWGEMIFESDNINNQWDGKFRNRIVQTGAYVYMVYANGYEKGKIFKSGTVNVIL